MQKAIFLVFISILILAFSLPGSRTNIYDDFPYDTMPDVLPGSKPLTLEGVIPDVIMDGAHKFIGAKINESVSLRHHYWNRNFSSQDAYTKSVAPNRKRFMYYIGVEDKSEALINYNQGLPDKHPPVFMQKLSFNDDSELVAETSRYYVYQVRWPVLNRVYGEGLLIQPKSKPVANIIALPDADQTPEQLAGLAPGVAEKSQFARRLAENGYQVLIPVMINREALFKGRNNEQTYREWLYRQAFHMGRHIIGYEVMKVMSAIDWFAEYSGKDLKTGVAGYCEGGLIAFYSAAVDTRIDVVMVSGYFNSRQEVWDEPIYRNVWGLLTEFGDAEMAKDTPLC